MLTGLVFGQRAVAAALSLLIASACTICAAPKISVNGDPEPGGYEKVYLLEGGKNNDPAKIFPGLLKRLQKIGFNATEFNPKNVPFTSQGTGFLLTPEGLVMTCAHVVGKETNATLWIESVRRMGRVVAIDTNLDAAAIQVEGDHPALRPVLFSKEGNYHIGQDVFSMGFPLADMLGTQPRLTKGSINSTFGLEDDPKTLQTSVPLQAGNSGGPLLNERCEVIGMVSSTLNPLTVLTFSGGNLPQNVNFAIKKAPLEEFLAKSKLSVPEGTNSPSTGVFDEVAKSLVLIRGGIVDEERLKEKSLACICRYSIVNGYFYGLRLSFVDLRKFKLVLSVSLDQPTYSSQWSVLDRMLDQVGVKFFPERKKK